MFRILWILILFSINPLLAQPSWQVIGKMPHPVYGGEAIVMDSLILIIGGTQSLPDQGDLTHPLGLIQAYDPRANSWQILDTLNVPRYGFAADTLDRNQLVICGGSWERDQNSYSIERWRFDTMAFDNPEVIYRDNFLNRIYFTGHIYQNRLYLFGGLSYPTSDIANRTSDLIVFDLSSNREVFNSDSTGRKHYLPYHHASVRINDTVYLLGGVFNGVTNTIRSYSINSDQIENAAYKNVGNMLTFRAGCRAVALPGSIFVLGGYNEKSTALKSTETISLTSFAVQHGPEMQHPRRELMAAVFAHSVYVFGGWNEQDAVVAEVERLEIDSAAATGIDAEAVFAENPRAFELGQNYPNPFNSSTIIPVRLSHPEYIRLEIYTVTGNRIRNLQQGVLQGGSYRFRWDGTDEQSQPAASGVYFYRLFGENTFRAGKMILLR